MSIALIRNWFLFSLLLAVAPIHVATAATAADISQLMSACEGKQLGVPPMDHIENCTRILSYDGITPRQKALALYWIGVTHDFGGDHEASLRYLDEAAMADPTYPEPLITAGLFRCVGRDPLSALDYFDRAIKIDAKQARAWSGRARAKFYSGDYQGALKESSKAIELDPGDPSIRYFHGRLLELLNRPDEAVPHFIFATKGYDNFNPRLPGVLQDEDPWIALSRVMAKARGPLAGANTLTQRLEKMPAEQRSSYYYEVRASFYKEGGVYEKAAADFAEAALRAEPPERSRFQLERAMLLLRAGKVDESQRAITALLRTGSLNAILRVQVHLRNSGFEEVEITGKFSDAMLPALDKCFENESCVSKVLHSI
jgi:tetratricopeptide (TPR) repeat protein